MTGAAEVFRAMLATASPEAALWDGLDDAIVGIGLRDTKLVAVYDYDRMVAVFCAREGWEQDAAVEWVEYNVIGAYVGPYTPLVQTRPGRWCDPWETL